MKKSKPFDVWLEQLKEPYRTWAHDLFCSRFDPMWAVAPRSAVAAVVVVVVVVARWRLYVPGPRRARFVEGVTDLTF